MPTYRQADSEDVELLAEVMQAYHPQLAEYGVEIGLLSAHAARDENGMSKGPALKLHGEACLAIVKVNALKCRVEGKPDATITLCGDSWPELPEARKRALLDHELTHLVLQFDGEGQVKLDDAGRPKLKTRPHDAVLGLFWSVVDRHGVEACESQSYREIHREFSQRAFPWG